MGELRRARAPLAAVAALVALGACREAPRVAPAETSGAGGQAASAPAAVAPWFTDVAAGSGIDFVHATGASGKYYLPEVAAGGACLIDYDRDGLLDVYFVQSGSLDAGPGPGGADKLYKNLGNWKFRDATAEAGLGDPGYGMGCATGDYDADGDVDLYVTNVGADTLWRNDGGRFTDVTVESGTGDPAWGSSVAFTDADGDGQLDIFVANYIVWSPASEIRCSGRLSERDYCSPKNYRAPARDTLYLNRGGGRFEDVSDRFGLRTADGNGLGVAPADYDGDGRTDMFVANDGVPNQLWMNRGGSLEDKAVISGCAVEQQGWPEAGMGVLPVDYDDDGDFDIFLTALEEETNTLYVNEGGRFRDRTSEAGLAAPSLGMTGWGTAFVDFDQDGMLDVFVANGRVKRAEKMWSSDPYAEPNLLFRGRAGGKYEVVPEAGTTPVAYWSARAAAFGDLDEDGDVDVVVANRDAGPRLLRNDAAKGKSLELRVLDARGVDAYGAVVTATNGGRTRMRLVQTAYSYCAANDPRVHFGLGDAAGAERVIVRWPSGEREDFGAVPAGIATLKQGGGKPAAP